MAGPSRSPRRREPWLRGERATGGEVVAPADPAVTAFHRGLPGYRPTPLISVPALARELAVGSVLVKLESSRLGLPAFKILGASWAVYRTLCDRLGTTIEPTTGAMATAAAEVEPALTLATATDGNHGRAVARMAQSIGIAARVWVPATADDEVVTQIAGEGADVVRVDGSYDDAVDTAARSAASAEHLALVQDTAWPGYETVPARVVEGYSTMFGEIDDQVSELGVDAPRLCFVPVGVGSLAQAAVAHYAAAATGVVSVEPVGAAPLLASLAARRPVRVETSPTVMAGLDCGTVSSLAWPVLRDGVEAAVAVSDEDAHGAVGTMADVGIEAGPSGAASLAGARRLLSGTGAEERRRPLGIDERSVLVLLVTEGPATRRA